MFKNIFNFAFGSSEYSGGAASIKSLVKGKFPINKFFAVMFIALIIIGVIYFISILFAEVNKTINLNRSDSNSVAIPPSIASQPVNKEFPVPVKDDKGEEISKLKFVIENAELRDQIVVKGQKASAVSGRDFLVINLKITNDFDKTVQISTRDYLRLSVNGNDKELLAPEIHNDPVEIQAQSTKYTRVAFAINESDKKLKLRIGEIGKNKTIIDLNKLR